MKKRNNTVHGPLERTLLQQPHHIPRSSIFHPGQSPLVNRLTAILIKPSSLPSSHAASGTPPSNSELREHVELKILSDLLPCIVHQFASALDDDEVSSASRCEAARCVIQALSYSMQVDDAIALDVMEKEDGTAGSVACKKQEILIVNGRETRLLCLVCLATLLKQLDRSKLTNVFTPPKQLNSRYQPTTPCESAQVILSAFTSLLAITNVLSWHKPTIPEDIAWTAQSLLSSFVGSLQRMIGAVKERKNVGDLEVGEEFVKGMIKNLTKLAASVVNNSDTSDGLKDEQVHICTSSFVDLVYILPSTIHPQRPPANIKVLSHHLVLVKHICLPMLRYVISRPSTGAHAARVFGLFGAILTRISESSDFSSSSSSSSISSNNQVNVIKHTESSIRHVAHLMHLISRALLDSVAQYYSVSREGDQSRQNLWLEPEWATHIVRWALEVNTHRMISLFVFPIIQAFCGANGKSWMAGMQVIIDIYRDTASNATESEPCASDPSSYILKTLIYVASSRPVTDSIGDSAAGDNYRLFCIKTLSMLPDSNPEILATLVALFQQPWSQIKEFAARCAAIRSLNLDLMSSNQFKSASVMYPNLYHRDGHQCTNLAGSNDHGSTSSFPVNDPYKSILVGMDEVGSSDAETLDCWRIWTRTLTRKKDIRMQVVHRFSHALEKKLSSTGGMRRQVDIAAHVVMGVLEGSQLSHRRVGNGLACDGMVFRIMAPSVFALRRDPDSDIRVKTLECLAKCLGIIPWLVEDNDKLSDPCFPDSPGSTSNNSSDGLSYDGAYDEEDNTSALVMVYRIAHCIPPFAENPKPILDDAEGEPQLRRQDIADIKCKKLKKEDMKSEGFQWSVSSKVYEDAIRRAEQGLEPPVATNPRVWWAAEDQIRHVAPADEWTHTESEPSPLLQLKSPKVTVNPEQPSVFTRTHAFFEDALQNAAPCQSSQNQPKTSIESQMDTNKSESNPQQHSVTDVSLLDSARNFFDEALMNVELMRSDREHQNDVTSMYSSPKTTLFDALNDHLKTLEDLERVTAEVAQIRQSALVAENGDNLNESSFQKAGETFKSAKDWSRAESVTVQNDTLADVSTDWKPVNIGLSTSGAEVEDVSTLDIRRDSLKPSQLVNELPDVNNNIPRDSRVSGNKSRRESFIGTSTVDRDDAKKRAENKILETIADALGDVSSLNGSRVEGSCRLDTGDVIKVDTEPNEIARLVIDAAPCETVSSSNMNGTSHADNQQPVNAEVSLSAASAESPGNDREEVMIGQDHHQDDYMHLDEILHMGLEAVNSPAAQVVASFPLVDAHDYSTAWYLNHDKREEVDKSEGATDIADLVQAAIDGGKSDNIGENGDLHSGMLHQNIGVALSEFMSGEPSQVLGDVDRSPITFEWSGIVDRHSEHDGKTEVLRSARESILPPRINSPHQEPALAVAGTTNHKNNITTRHIGNILKTSIKLALDLTLRHLVFTSQVEGPVDYLDLYGTGIYYGSLARWEGIPAAGEVEALRDVDGRKKNYQVAEGLHPALKEALKLDAGLLMSICASVDVSGLLDGCRRKSLIASPNDKLKTWLSGLVQIHRKLLPVSKSLRRLSSVTKSVPTSAQALVLLRDQAEISRVAGLHRGENSDVSKAMNGNTHTFERSLQEGNTLDMNSFLHWMKQV
ncbi:hypothetical protein SeLEV6574_g00541 [Synchytrium endobioticum]|nr:hypothetical protein SeLEV6574_g00541 [Synchytrium endobioticum]